MNTLTKNKTEPAQYPKGVTWTWDGESASHPPLNLTHQHSPTVQIDRMDTPITWLGSFNGVDYSVIRDKEGEIVRMTKLGVYRLPVAVCYLRPVSDGAITARIFIQG